MSIFVKLELSLHVYSVIMRRPQGATCWRLWPQASRGLALSLDDSTTESAAQFLLGQNKCDIVNSRHLVRHSSSMSLCSVETCWCYSGDSSVTNAQASCFSEGTFVHFIGDHSVTHLRLPVPPPLRSRDVTTHTPLSSFGPNRPFQTCQKGL